MTLPSRRLQTKPVITCLQTFLISYSLIFWVTGVILLAVGIWGKVGLETYISMVSKDSGNALYVLIGTGAVIIVFGLFGCVAACRGSPWMLKSYAMFLALVFLAELAAGISGFIFRHQIKSSFGKAYDSAVTNYDGSGSGVYVDYIQRRFHCCGVHNYTDWKDTKYFSTQGIPATCCKDPMNCKPETLKNLQQAADEVYQTGCYLQMTRTIEDNLGIVAGIAFGIAFFQLIGVFLAFCLSRAITNNQYEMV
ncbi:tetraspanin-6 [Cynoglossus semilaevis]|uniref:Tetraspanin n=1 Tax=Cynoglossus semilaevis TaxID=244447 RepID=A0A3P8UNX6_CYNSE|nr:tetraspanin-6 [Cynoglossus semilaevis]XP_024918706.1 tetraspanin-6 [Cynoglossus semilaevis]XP_024918707.1 tetraspanin-6 [Cynoglossus semilaevis]